MATLKKNKIALPPKFVTNEEAMEKMINKGGSTSVISDVSADELKSFTINIYESELAKIREIINRVPKRDQVSLRTFITESVLARIESEY